MRLTHGVVGARSGVRVGLFIHEIIAGPRTPVTRVYGSSSCKARAFRPYSTWSQSAPPVVALQTRLSHFLPKTDCRGLVFWLRVMCILGKIWKTKESPRSPHLNNIYISTCICNKNLPRTATFKFSPPCSSVSQIDDQKPMGYIRSRCLKRESQPSWQCFS